MRPMYPHELDRFRALEKILRLTREIRGLSQKELVERIHGFSRSKLSNAENLSAARLNPKRRTSRDDLWKILRAGLTVESPLTISALFWLLDGQPVHPSEANLYRVEPLDEDVTSEILRIEVLRTLRHLLEFFDSGSTPEPQNAKVRRHFSTGWFDYRSTEDQLEMEEHPGQDLLLKRELSFRLYPPDAIRAIHEARATKENPAPELKNKVIDLELRRVQTLDDALTGGYGVRHIYHWPSVVRGANTPRSDRTHEHQMSQLTRLLALMDSHSNFEVRLLNEEPHCDFEAKNFVSVVLQTVRRYDFDELVPHDSETASEERSVLRKGLRALSPTFHHWYDEASVIEYTLGFEEIWDSITEPDNMERKRVMERFSELRNSPNTAQI